MAVFATQLTLKKSACVPKALLLYPSTLLVIALAPTATLYQPNGKPSNRICCFSDYSEQFGAHLLGSNCALIFCRPAVSAPKAATV